MDVEVLIHKFVMVEATAKSLSTANGNIRYAIEMAKKIYVIHGIKKLQGAEGGF